MAENEEAIVRFVRLALRWDLDDTARDSAQALASQPDFAWQEFLRLARRERLSALLHRSLGKQDFVPRRVRRILRDDYRYEVRRSLFLRQELDAVLRLFSCAGVEVIVLKGAALAEVVYGDWAARPMQDLDLLVQPEQLPVAAGALRVAGFAQSVEPRGGAALAYENEIAFGKAGVADEYVELHWSLFDSPYYQNRLPLNWLWETAVSSSFGDSSAMVLGPEAQLLHLSGHLALHHAHDATLLWLHDVSMLIRHHGASLDWNLVLEQAQACRLVIPLQQVLDWVTGEMDVAVPADTMLRLRSLSASSDERQVFSWHTAAERSVAQRIWSDLAYIPGWVDRLRYVWLKLFPSPKYMKTRYHIRRRGYLPVFYAYHLLSGMYGGIGLLAQVEND